MPATTSFLIIATPRWHYLRCIAQVALQNKRCSFSTHPGSWWVVCLCTLSCSYILNARAWETRGSTAVEKPRRRILQEQFACNVFDNHIILAPCVILNNWRRPGWGIRDCWKSWLPDLVAGPVWPLPVPVPTVCWWVRIACRLVCTLGI